MPLYVIKCKCNGEIEALSREAPGTCPKCGGEVGSDGCKLQVGPHAKTPNKWKVGK